MQSQGKPRPSSQASRPAEGMICAICALRDDQGLLRAVPENNPSSFYAYMHSYKDVDIYCSLSMNDNSTKEITRSCCRDQIAKGIVVSFVQQGISQTFRPMNIYQEASKMADILQNSMGVEPITPGWPGSQRCSKILKFLVRLLMTMVGLNYIAGK